MTDKLITFFDLFSGIGGFHLAIKRLGWKCVGFCEIDKPCRKTYFVNFPEMIGEWYCHDVRNIKEGELPDFDVLVAGFPCQSFSLAGKRLGFEDTRGTLFFEIVRILRDNKPKAFLLENVKGLTYHDKGKTLEIILNTLKELGYDVHHKVLNSKDFGVPQNRERIFFVGFRNGKVPFEFPEGFPLTIRLKDIMEEEVLERYYLAEKYVKKFLKMKSEGNGSTDVVLTSHTKANITKRRQKRDKSWTLDGSGSKIGVIIKREGQTHKGMSGQVYSPEGISPTIKSGSSKSDGGRDRMTGQSVAGLYKTKQRIRRLTPRECARLQGFPDSFCFPVSDTQAYKQLGNAVTVTVVESIVRNMEKYI